MNCAKVGCDGTGKWKPVLLCWAWEGHPPARCEIGIRICDAHKKTAVAEDFLGGEVWPRLVQAITATGGVAPERHLTKLGWVLPT